MLGITDFPAFLLITTITVLLPGPNSLFVLSVAARQGVRDGYRAALGVFVGDGLLMLASVAGLAPLLAANPQVFTVLKLLGAGYLSWMGLGLLKAGWKQWRERALPSPLVKAEKEGWVTNPFRRTLGICLLNPKAILFFMAFFIASPIPPGLSETITPAARRASIFSAAPPPPPEMMAPAWPIRLPGGAV